MATRFAGTELTNFMSTPDFGRMSKVGMDAQTMERNSATKAEGLVHGAGINSMAQVASAGFQADAIKAQGQAQAQASIASGIGSMVSGIAGGFGSMGSGSSGVFKYASGPGSSGTPMGAGGGVVGGYGTLGPNYGIYQG